MGSLFFPQMTSGALAQYPIRKHRTIRTVKNLLADGSMIVASDSGAGQMVWTLSYVDLPPADMQALRTLFESARGPLAAFTFLDPTENLLLHSTDFTQSPWIVPPDVTVESGVPDPVGGVGAFRFVNASAATQQIVQTLQSPVSFQYCFSVYALATNSGLLTLTRASANAEVADICAVGPSWSRISSSGALEDCGLGFTVGISLLSGQSVTLYGPQLEPQFAPSRFRPTYSNSGLYANAHWATAELIFTAEGPNLFATSFTIEASLSS